MKDYPLLSVIVPVYKVEAYLDRCIHSITEQTYRNLEVILVDDGSPDGSGAICDAWAAADSRIRVVHKQNGGGGAARNTALDLAQGELIAFVDSDDYIAPEMFAYLYDLLQQGADIAECGYVETVDDHAAFPKNAGAPRTYTREEAMAEHIQDRFFRQLIWNKLYRREMVEGVRFPVGTKIDDEFFTYRVLGNARKLIHSDRVCYAYRQQPGSVMHEAFSLKRVEGLLAKQQRLAYLQKEIPSLEYEAKAELLFSCIYAMQGSLRSLKGEELEQARKLIAGVMADAVPLEGSPAFSKKKNILMKLAQSHFEGTCRLLNFLIDIHVLT